MRLYVLARHAQSVLNIERRINGDPSRPAALTDLGHEEAQMLGLELRSIPLERCVHTRFARTRETAEVALAGRDVPLAEEPLLDDIYVGELEGESIDAYRAWKRSHRRSDRFPGGESLDDAGLRYARGCRRLLEDASMVTLVVCHEIAIRYALNAEAGSEDFDAPVHEIPNATPFLFGEDALARAADGIERLLGRS